MASSSADSTIKILSFSYKISAAEIKRAHSSNLLAIYVLENGFIVTAENAEKKKKGSKKSNKGAKKSFHIW